MFILGIIGTVLGATVVDLGLLSTIYRFVRLSSVDFNISPIINERSCDIFSNRSYGLAMNTHGFGLWNMSS